MIIAIDFDGTMVEHSFPAIGQDIGAWEWLRKIQEEGGKIILWTMRSGEYLTAAVEEMVRNGIVPWGINENPEQKSWTSSPKAYAHKYIDDSALGCPLVDGHVNWLIMGPSILRLIRMERENAQSNPTI